MGRVRSRREQRPFAPGALAWTLIAVAAALALTVDDRHAGRIEDEREIAGTAVALTEGGGLAVACDPLLRVVATAPGGDYVSRYGLGGSFVQVPAALAAPFVERSLGPGTSNPLFLVAPILLVLFSGWASGRLAVLLGGGPAAAAVAALLATLASPLASYASIVLSDQLQAACLAGTLLSALASAAAEQERRSLLLAAAAGLFALGAVLAKSVLAVVAAPLLLPLLAGGAARPALRRAAAAAAAGAPLAGLWAWLELRRFGAILGGYPGESFTHPVWDGVVRLLVLPNRGLIFFVPALVVAIPVAAGLIGRKDGPAPPRLAAAGASISFVVLAALSGAWWCWSGNVGWGPRLLVPAVPFLAPFAAIWVAARPPGLRAAVVGLGIALNVPPLFAHPGVIASFVSSCPWRAIDVARARTILPGSAIGRNDGQVMASPSHLLPYVQSAAPHVLTTWFAWASLAPTPEAAAARLVRPPWLEAEPTIVPPRFNDPGAEIPWVAPSFRWGWGRSFLSGTRDPALVPIYLIALENQVVRLLDDGPADRAIAAAARFRELARSPDADAYYLEALRLAGRRETAADLVRTLAPARSSPLTSAAVALLLRDLGQSIEAGRAMRAAGAAGGGSPYSRYANADPGSWPRDLLSLRGRLAPRASS